MTIENSDTFDTVLMLAYTHPTGPPHFVDEDGYVLIFYGSSLPLLRSGVLLSDVLWLLVLVWTTIQYSSDSRGLRLVEFLKLGFGGFVWVTCPGGLQGFEDGPA